MQTLKSFMIALLFCCFASQIMAQQTLEKTQEQTQQAEEASPSDTEAQEKGTTEQKKPSADSHEKEEPKAEESKDEKQDDQPKDRTRRRRGKSVFTKRSETFVNVFSPLIESKIDSIVRITDGKKQTALGTVVGSDGLILTKASELRGDLTCKLSDGTEFKPTIYGIDPDTDLVLLKIEKSGLATIQLEEEFLPEVGSWLATVDQESTPLAVGIVSHKARKIRNNIPNSAIIGIFPVDREEGDGVRINKINNDSPAEKAGLLVNDIIIEIDDEKISNRQELLVKLSHYRPGDEIQLKYKRGAEEKEVPVTLGERKVNPMQDRGVRQNKMGSTLSKRRSDFPLALQHDTTLNANECGSPVVDLDGRIVGINIARDGRVSSLALPNEVVLPVIEKLKTGEWTPEVVNKKKIVSVKRELEKLEKDLGDLPQQKIEMEMKFSAGAAVENELKRQLDEAEERLAKLKARFEKQKKENGEATDAITEIQGKKDSIERKREPLKRELKQLKTGVR